MNNLINEFIQNINAGNLWVGFLVLAIFYIIKKEPFKIFTHLSKQKIKDIDQAKSLLEIEKLSKKSNELIREHIESYAFKKYYGINTHKKMRETLLNFHQKHQDKISWIELKRAFQYIELEDSKIKIVLKWHSQAGSWVISILSWVIALYSLSVIVLAFLIRSGTPLQFFTLTFLALLLLASSLFFSSLDWPYKSAIKIKEINEKHSNE